MSVQAMLPRLRDTMVRAHLAYPDSWSGLEHWGSIVTDLPHWKDMKETGNIYVYNGYDVYGADRLEESLGDECEELGLEPLLATQQRCQLALYYIGRRGIRIDADKLAAAEAEIDTELAALVEDTEFASMNWRSNPQLHELFKQRHGSLPRSRQTRRETLDKHALKKFAVEGDDLARRLLQLRELDKGRSTYISTYRQIPPDADGKVIVRSSLALHRAGTGRIQGAEPNLLQIPKRSPRLKRLIRSLFIPRYDGWVLVEADWRQIEAVLVYYFSGCTRLLEAVLSGTRDIHQEHADRYGVSRDTAKIATHGTHYEATPSELAYQFDLPVEQVAAVQKQYLAENPEIPAWWEKVGREVYDNRGIQRLPFGRIRRYYGKIGDWRKEAVATAAQGTVADMLIRVVPLLEDAMQPHNGWAGHFLLPVHDANLCEVDVGQALNLSSLLRLTMAQPWLELDGLAIPIDIKVGPNWAEAR